MKAITIAPNTKPATKIREVEQPTPKEDEALVKVTEAGICRTDLEIYNGFYGEYPKGADFLIMGHESIGQVEATGANVTGLKKGDYVARTVRRPCSEEGCINCRAGETDFCMTGKYTETGIKGLHGIMTEYYADKPEYLVRVPQEFAKVGVLMEPLSFSEKAVTQAYKVQRRISWQPRRALIFGAGPIGLLEAMVLRNKGIETYVAARSEPGNKKSRIAEQIGAHYISTQDTDLADLGKFDIVIESSGSLTRIMDALGMAGTNGVVCLTSITGGSDYAVMPIEKINLDIVLGNKAIIGAVNASISDYHKGLEDMADFERKWPGTLSSLITKRVKPEQYAEAFEHGAEDIKTVIEFY